MGERSWEKWNKIYWFGSGCNEMATHQIGITMAMLCLWPTACDSISNDMPANSAATCVTCEFL